MWVMPPRTIPFCIEMYSTAFFLLFEPETSCRPGSVRKAMCATKPAPAHRSLPPRTPRWDAAAPGLARGCLRHRGGLGEERDGGAGRDLHPQFSPTCLFFVILRCFLGAGEMERGGQKVRAGGPQRSFPGLGRAWGGGGCHCKCKTSRRTTVSLGQRKRRQRHKGVGFLLPFFFSGGIQCDEFSARASATL